MDQFGREDLDLLSRTYDQLMDKGDLSKKFENEIHSSFANVKTLLDG